MRITVTLRLCFKRWGKAAGCHRQRPGHGTDLPHFDEPMAGLDPRGRREIMEQIKELHEAGLTVILISHSMDDVAQLTKRLIVMHQGRIVFDDDTRHVFTHYARLQELGLDIPTVTKLVLALRSKGWKLREDIFTVEEAKEEILKALREESKQC